MQALTAGLLAAGLLIAGAGCALADGHPEIPAWSEGAELISVSGPEVRIDAYSGIVFHQPKEHRGIIRLLMTVFSPRTQDKKPAIVYLPGGGFTGSDHEKYVVLRTALARAGFVVAAAQYRPVPSVFPAILEDGKAAVRYLREHAEQFGIDPDRIGLLGDSAGGYLVELMGAVNGEKGWDAGDYLDKSSDVQAVVSLYGISDLTCIGEGMPEFDATHGSPAATEALLLHGAAFGDFPGASITSDAEKAKNASAIGHIDGNEPPFLIMHGTSDKIVSPMQSKHLYEAMKAKGDDVRYVMVDGAGHGDSPWFQREITDLIVEWFIEKLGAPEKRGEGAGSNL